MSFFRKASVALLERSLIWAVLNAVFFGSILAFSLVTRYPVLLEPSAALEDFPPLFPLSLEVPWLLVYIFVFNLVVSAFLVVTLPGALLFVSPSFFLLLRGYFWGMSLCRLSTPALWAALPTIVIEGEAYVLAAVAGTILGLSWLKPHLVFKDKVTSRHDAFALALKEAAYLYVLVIALLIVAAVVEAMTLQNVYQI